MVDDSLAELAAAAGLALQWQDIDGAWRSVTPDAACAILRALGHACESQTDRRRSLRELRDVRPASLVVDVGTPFFVPIAARGARLVLETGEARDLELRSAPGGGQAPGIDELGYHRLECGGASFTLAVCPRRCVTPHDLLGRRAWGLTAQIYSLAGPGGFGDFGDLASLAATTGKAGGDALAISPTHALFAASPGTFSPYSPSNRDHLNPLLGTAAGLGVAPEPAQQGRLIDWDRASPVKLAELRRALDGAGQDERRAAFILAGGEGLRRHAVFEALHGHFSATAAQTDWRLWPAAFRDASTAEARARELGLEAEIAFHLSLQWLADLGLEQAQTAARANGMGLGLISDLAVGLDPAGSHAWARPDELLTGLTLGAPPDRFAAEGQAWGITSFAPTNLRETGFAAFLRTVRAALRHAGGVRIDHALGLNRLWVLPQGAKPLEGAYLSTPRRELLGLLALESHRRKAVVIGEDLGVVPEGLRAELKGRGVLGMRVLPFEEEAGRPRPPRDWDDCAVAMTSTHDLPPVAGWWRGVDLAWRQRLDAGFEAGPALEARAQSRTGFWAAAVEEDRAQGPEPAAEDPQPAVDAALAYVAATACQLALLPLEDLVGQEDAVNLPGVVDQHPNWRRRFAAPSPELLGAPQVRRRLEQLRTERPK